jgi:hypothetical protein
MTIKKSLRGQPRQLLLDHAPDAAPITVAVPRWATSMAASNSGTSGRSAASRLLRARKTMTAMFAATRFCWNERLRSTVTNTFKRLRRQCQELAVLDRSPAHLTGARNFMTSDVA